MPVPRGRPAAGRVSNKFSGETPGGNIAELSLRQNREFVCKFLRDDRKRAEMLGPLQANYALRHAAVMTFACLLHEDGLVNQSTTIGELDVRMPRKFISGNWRRDQRPEWANASVREERSLGFLGRRG